MIKHEKLIHGVSGDTMLVPQVFSDVHLFSTGLGHVWNCADVRMLPSSLAYIHFICICVYMYMCVHVYV